MQETNIYGKLEKGVIEVNKNYHNYIDDSSLFIMIDGRYNDKSYVKKVRDLYLKYGEGLFEHIDEFFSIYLYDKKNNILLLSRDRMGLRSVYYCNNNGTLYFGNDLMLVVNNYHLKKIIEKKVIPMYFYCHYINPPETIFKNIYKLEHGKYLIYKNQQLEVKTYWSEIEQFNKNSYETIKDYAIAKKTLENLITKEVKEFIKSEKNFGIYMSGGIDSSLVTALCKKYSDKKINTFTIGFNDEKKNEATKAKRIAKYLGTNHHELYIEMNRITDFIKKIPKYYTEPFADSSEIPTIIINELGRKNHIECAFTGDGSDQLFCGSGTYDTIKKAQLLYKILNPINVKINFKNKLMYIYGNTDKRYQSQLDFMPYDKYMEGLLLKDGKTRFDQEINIQTKNWQEKRMILDIGTFMADRVSVKMGTASKKNNIDLRTPFFSKDVIEYSFKIPHHFKYYHKIKKYIIKEILYDYVPKELLSEEKKGFGIPIRKWLKTYLLEDLKRVSNKEYLKKQNIFNYKAINNLIDNIDSPGVTTILWDFYIFQLWYNEYMIK